MTATASINNQEHLEHNLNELRRMYDEHQFLWITWSVDKARSNDQNALIYALYANVSKQMEGWTKDDVRRYCKLEIGIRKALKGSAKYWEEYGDLLKSVKDLPYEGKLKLMDVMPVTSEMSKGEATEYIDLIHHHFAEQGCVFV